MADHDKPCDPFPEDILPATFTPPPHPFAPMLSFLAFEAPFARIGIETTFCILLFALLDPLPWASIGLSPMWSPLAAWLVACTIVGVVDTVLFRRAFFVCREAYQLALSGAYERALTTLDRIAPQSGCATPCPRGLYHLIRADIFAQAETPLAAHRELTSALAAGVDPSQVMVMRSRIERANENYAEARRRLEEARTFVGDRAVLLLEEGLTHLEERSDLRIAQRLFDRVRTMPAEPHPSGDTTRELAIAYHAACQLWTGEAEEGLRALSRAIDRLRSIVRYVDTLRPVLARLCAERSYYFATHREPQGALVDVRIASALCASRQLRCRYEKIREELEWRHKILLPPMS